MRLAGIALLTLLVGSGCGTEVGNGLSFPNPDDTSGSRKSKSQPNETVASDAKMPSAMPESQDESAKSGNTENTTAPGQGGGAGDNNMITGPAVELVALTAPCLGFFAQAGLARESFDLVDASGAALISVMTKSDGGWIVSAASGHVIQVAADNSISATWQIPATQCSSSRQVVVNGTTLDVDWRLDGNGLLEFFSKTAAEVELILQARARAN